ncbi:MAB_1171c family putative transporter [Streptomyces sp. NPDC099050]|uniref:MAB_1171c family putative transporter n=1 Tax=Streptomyces sp. NPDC099050 TaxID=3366100 RepID=UPI003812EB93
MSGSDYYIPAGALLIALLVKSPWFWRNWHSPMAKSILVILASPAAGFLFGAPPTIERVNRFIGVPNISALIVFCILSCLSCASNVLLIHWRGDAEDVLRRRTRIWVAATAALIVTFCVLFHLGSMPVERRRDFDTFYANTPFVRELIVLSLTAHFATTLLVATRCWRWARGLRELHAAWTHAGLLILVAAFGFGLSFALFKFLAVGARWAGTDRWDWLSTDVAPPLAGVGACMTAVGILLPAIGQGAESRWRALHRFRRLRPLWSEIRRDIPPTSPPPMPWWKPVERRLMQRETDIFDAVLRLTPWFDHTTGTKTYALALADHSESRRARSEADASVLAHAVIRKGLARPPVTPEQRWTITSTEDSEDLVDLSAAMLRSPHVRTTRRTTAGDGLGHGER